MILGRIKNTFEVLTQEFNVKPVGLKVCSSWGHIQRWSGETGGFNRLVLPTSASNKGAKE